MNLAQMAAFICGKVNQSETEDLTACKGFLAQRQELLWAEALWKDALTEYRLTLSPTGYTTANSWLPTKGVLLVPPTIGEVLAVRSDTRKLNIHRPEFYYRVDFDAFAQNGDAADYVLLSRCVWEFDTAQNCIASSPDPGDATAKYYLDYLETDGVTVSRLTDVLGDGDGVVTDRVDALLKQATNATVQFTQNDNNGAHPILSLTTTDQAARKRERVRLIRIPTASLTLRLLGKLVCPSLTNDLDEPAIHGSENCLLAFAQADMLERERQYGKAQLVSQGQANPLLQQLKAVETVQQAHHQQIVPESGYGEDVFSTLQGFSF